MKSVWKKWLYWFLLGMAIIVVYKALDNFKDIAGVVSRFFEILSPFLVGGFIAYLLYMPCKKIEEFYSKSKKKWIKKKARSLSVTTVYIIALILIVILFNCILPVVVESIADLINNFQGHYELAIKKYQSIPEDSLLKGTVVKGIVENIQQIDIKQYFRPDRIWGYIAGAVNVVTSLFSVFVTLIVSIYILVERAKILDFIKRLASAMLKEQTYQNIDKYFNNSNEIFFKFVVSQFLDALVVGTLVTIAMSIMRVKYAPLLGFFIGLFNMIPYVGAIIAVAIAAIITLITGGVSQAIWMLIVVIALQQIDANIINPKIIGQSLKISPLLVIFAITVGGAYFGMLGMFLAVPIIAVVKIIVEDYIRYKLAVKKCEKEIREMKVKKILKKDI